MLAIAMTYIFHRRIGSVILKDNYEVHRKKWIAFIRRKEEYEMTDKELKKTKIQEIIALIIFALSLGYLVQGFIVSSCAWKTLFA